MNLSKTLIFLNNILLILIILLSFIFIIVNNTIFTYSFNMFDNEIQPQSIVILISSLILLLFNSILTKFIKNKLLIIIINLILAVSLITTSIYLFVSLQKIKPPQLPLKSINFIKDKSLEDIIKLVSVYQSPVNESNIKINTLTKTYNETKINLDNFDKLQKDLSQYIIDLSNAQDAYNKNPIESNNLLIKNIENNLQKITYELNNEKYYYNASDARTLINNNLINLQNEINNEKLTLNDRQNALVIINNDLKYLINMNSYNNNYNNIKVVEGLSYSVATLSIISGILIPLILLMKN